MSYYHALINFVRRFGGAGIDRNVTSGLSQEWRIIRWAGSGVSPLSWERSVVSWSGTWASSGKPPFIPSPLLRPVLLPLWTFLLLPSSEGSADCGTLTYPYRELFSCHVCSPLYCIFCGV